MKKLLIALTFASFAASAHAQAGLSDKQFIAASRCSAMAASENLGKLDTTALEALLQDQSAGRKASVRISATSEMIAARRKADTADGAKKEKLLAERQSLCSGFLASTHVAAQ